MVGIDLFAGAGGMSLGATMAGINVKIAVEMDPYAAMTYAHNHKGVQLFNGDIRKFKKIELPRTHEQTVAFGGPPCRGFSTSNQRTRSADNENNWLFREYLRVVRMYSPDWVVFENVRGILETEHGFFVERIVKQLERLGYTLTHGVLNALDFGVPQNRSRFFIIGSKHGVRVHLPIGRGTPRVTVKEQPRVAVGSTSTWRRSKPYEGAIACYACVLRRIRTH
ncbi:MAG: DNA cytosine methyltransferase [Ignavibacteriae bacterium]|nr:DNA cytosine methyltransferase [Ignavibacteriota bacterium]